MTFAPAAQHKQMMLNTQCRRKKGTPTLPKKNPLMHIGGKSQESVVCVQLEDSQMPVATQTAQNNM